MRPGLDAAVLWDSSAMIAAIDASDAHHAAATTAVQRMIAEGLGAFTTNYLEVEAHALQF